jgi:hypothetical protein
MANNKYSVLSDGSPDGSPDVFNVKQPLKFADIAKLKVKAGRAVNAARENLLEKCFGKKPPGEVTKKPGFVIFGLTALTLASPIMGLIGIVVMFFKIWTNKNNWKTNEDADEKEKSRRSADRGQFISLCLMFSALIQAGIKATDPNEKALLVLYGFIFAAVIGFIGDQMVGGDDGQSFMKYVNPKDGKKEKKSWGHWFRYGLATLTTGSFFRYLITVFLDMFISGCMIDVFQIVATPITNNLVGFFGPNENSFGNKYAGALSKNFDNILQSVVAFATFMAYTNDTRFNWAYPPNTAKRKDIIPVPTIKLATSVAAIVYLVANIPKNSSRRMNFCPGKPMADGLGTKLLYVCITLGLLTMGSQGNLFNIDPLKDRKIIAEKLKQDDANNSKYAGKQKWYITQKKWLLGLIAFTAVNFIGIGIPLATSKNIKGGKKIVIACLCSIILPLIFGSIAFSAKDDWAKTRINIENDYAKQLKQQQDAEKLLETNGWEKTKDGKYKKGQKILELTKAIQEINKQRLLNNKWSQVGNNWKKLGSTTSVSFEAAIKSLNESFSNSELSTVNTKTTNTTISTK